MFDKKRLDTPDAGDKIAVADECMGMPVKEQPEQQADKPFRFLDLAGELRNNIYEKVAEDDTTYMNEAGIVTLHALASVNHQIRSEYLPVIPYACTTIKTTVTDFDFHFLDKYFHALSSDKRARFDDIHVQVILSCHSSEQDSGHVHDCICLERLRIWGINWSIPNSLPVNAVTFSYEAARHGNRDLMGNVMHGVYWALEELFEADEKRIMADTEEKGEYWELLKVWYAVRKEFVALEARW